MRSKDNKTELISKDIKHKEFWLCGEPNGYDVGIWYDHHPGRDAVYGKEFHTHHVIEYSAYKELRKDLEAESDKYFNMSQEAIRQVQKLTAERDMYKAEAKELREEIEFAVKYLKSTYSNAEGWEPEKQMLLSFEAALTSRSIKTDDKND